MGLIILSPVILVIVILIKIDSRGPVFFKQERAGIDGKTFRLYKLRSMVENASSLGKLVNEKNDTRVTRLGCFLRKYRLDEIPQLWNILIGDLTFVGPRPEVPDYVKFYSEEQKNIFKVKPGLFCLSTITYLNDQDLFDNQGTAEQQYIGKIMPAKIAIDLKYIEGQSFINDFKIFIKVFFRLFGKQ